MRLPYDIERKFRKFSISNLMNYIVAATAVIFVVDYAMPQYNLLGKLSLWRDLVFQGEIWRLITFVFVPEYGSIISTAIMLYLYWIIGTNLENRWGTVKFNMYYWLGIVGVIVTAMITGYASNRFLNLSLFLAFAILNPEFQMRAYLFIPIKVKYLALLAVIYFVVQLITGGASTRITILFSFLNLYIFLGGDFINWVKRDAKYWKTRRNFRKNIR